MSVFKNAVGVILKRPFVLFYIGVIVLLFFIVDYFSPVFSIIIGIFTLGDNSGLDAFLSLMQGVIDLEIMAKFIPFIIGLIIVISTIAALLFSGVLYVLNNAIKKGKKAKLEFVNGSKILLFRIFITTLICSLATVVFILFNSIASVPAIVITKALIAGKIELIIIAFFVDILTAAIIFFNLMFYRIYISFWYAAVVNNDSKALFSGIKALNKNFWPIFGKYFIFDMVFILFQFGSAYFKKLMF